MIYYCPACHYIYLASDARDKAFCPDCGMATPRPATEEEQKHYEADRESVTLHLREKWICFLGGRVQRLPLFSTNCFFPWITGIYGTV